MDTDATSAPTASTDITFRGVTPKKGGKYQATLYQGSKKISIGTYATGEEAARAHDREAKKCLGDQAVLNFLPTGGINPNKFARRGRGEKSMYKGVSQPTGRKTYQARVRYGGRLRYIGSFATEVEAAKAYDDFVKQHKTAPHVLNFNADGSLNPHRHDVIQNMRSGWLEAKTRRGQRHAGNVAKDNQQEAGQREEATRQEEEEEDSEDSDEEHSDEEEEEEQEGESRQEGETRQVEEGPHEEGGRRQRRRLNEDAVIDLTDDGPSQLTASSALLAAASAASKGRRATAAVGGGGPDGSIPPLRLPVQPMPKLEPASALPQPSVPTNVKVEAAAGVAPASVAQSTSHDGLKMTLLDAVNILGAETFTRLTACERGSEQMASLDRLMDTLQQLRHEARVVSASSSSSSSASPATSTADLRAFLLASVCPKYTAEELKASHLDHVMQISTLIVKL